MQLTRDATLEAAVGDCSMLTSCFVLCNKTFVLMQAMRDATLEAVVKECSMLIGCFVPCEETLPLLLSLLEAAVEPAAAAAVLQVIAAITHGAGKRLIDQ